MVTKSVFPEKGDAMNHSIPIQTAEILCVGTELLLGDIVNTNAAYLSRKLAELGIHIGAHILAIGECGDLYFDPMDPEIEAVRPDFPVIDEEAGKAMRDLISQARNAGDSVGGIIECAVTGLPAGIGEPIFGGVESKIAQIIYGIPAVKGLDFGIGFDCACVPGSQSNDDFAIVDGKVVTQTNNAGGILGGITNGMPLLFTVAMKATPSIACAQQSVNTKTMEVVPLEIKGRHDPCIVPRAVPVVEAAAAIAIYDLILGNTQTCRRKQVWN
jgi:chorismate synthase